MNAMTMPETWLRECESIELAVAPSEIHYAPVLAMRALKSLPLRIHWRRGHETPRSS